MYATCGDCGPGYCQPYTPTREERLVLLERQERALEERLKFIRDLRQALKSAKASSKTDED